MLDIFYSKIHLILADPSVQTKIKYEIDLNV